MKGVMVHSRLNKPSRVACNKTGCGFEQTWSTDAAAQAAACWHVFENHPKDWEQIIGNTRPPQDPRPGTLGEWLR